MTVIAFCNPRRERIRREVFAVGGLRYALVSWQGGPWEIHRLEPDGLETFIGYARNCLENILKGRNDHDRTEQRSDGAVEQRTRMGRNVAASERAANAGGDAAGTAGGEHRAEHRAETRGSVADAGGLLAASHAAAAELNQGERR